jgi:hypothetical protein
VKGTANNGNRNPEGIFLATEDYCYAILLLICQIRDLMDPESDPKDSGNEYGRLLDKPLAHLSDPLGGRVLLRKQSGTQEPGCIS